MFVLEFIAAIQPDRDRAGDDAVTLISALTPAVLAVRERAAESADTFVDAASEH